MKLNLRYIYAFLAIFVLFAIFSLKAAVTGFLALEGLTKAFFLLKGGLLLGTTNGVSYPTAAPTTPNGSANDFNASNCAPRLIAIDDAMSLTRANITGWNKADIESVMFKEVGLDKVIANTKEARMAGAMQRTLMDLLLSRHAPMKVGGGVANQSIIQPFRLVPRRNRVNPGYFRISAGAATTHADLTAAGLEANYVVNGSAVPGALWTVTINNGTLDNDSSWLVKSPNNALKNIEKYFLPRMGVTAEWMDPATGAKYTPVLHVVGSINVDANQAKIILAPNRSGAGLNNFFGNATGDWWGSASAAAKAAYQPTVGIVRTQANSVSDYESYGNALPGYNEYGLVDYWRQTTRGVHKYNDEYVKALQSTTTSDGLKKFRLLPLAKLKAQQEAMQEMSFFEACFYGDVEDENQSVSAWNSLPVVQDPAWAASGESGTLAIEYRSRTIGIRTQIAACGNVLDAQNGPLDLDALFEACYYVKREREGETGQQVTDIDIFTDQRFTRPLIRQLMTKFYKAKYSIDNVSMFMESGKKITFNGSVMFEYDSYELPDNGVTLNVFSDLYFDDRIAQFSNAQKSAGRQILMIDWSDIAVNLIKAMSVPRTNNLADNVYKYVIMQNVQHVLLNSKTFEVAVGNTNRHRIIENYSTASPKLTVPGVDLSAD